MSLLGHGRTIVACTPHGMITINVSLSLGERIKQQPSLEKEIKDTMTRVLAKIAQLPPGHKVHLL